MLQSQLSEKEKVKIAISSGCHKFRSAKTSKVSGKEHAEGVSYSTTIFPFQLELGRRFYFSSFWLAFRLPTPGKTTCVDFPGGPVVKNLPYNAGDSGLIIDWRTKVPQALKQLSPLSHNH